MTDLEVFLALAEFEEYFDEREHDDTDGCKNHSNSKEYCVRHAVFAIPKTFQNLMVVSEIYDIFLHLLILL